VRDPGARAAQAVTREHALPSPVSCVAYVADAAAIAQTFRDLIEAARSSIVLQMYMFAGNGETEALRRREGVFPYARTIAEWLVARRERSPELDIVVVLDTQTLDDARLTRNRTGPLTRHILERAGIPVLHANLFGTAFDRSRRFPPAAGLHRDERWRAVPEQAYGRAQQRWQTWHNVEDHRKNLVIDQGAWAAVTSHNFLDVAADWHENLFLVGAPAAGEVWRQARAAIAAALELPQRLDAPARARIAALAAHEPSPARELARTEPAAALRALGNPAAVGTARDAPVEVLTTLDIRPRLIESLRATGPGDRVCAASAWFSDIELFEAFAAAAERGADVALLVDDLVGLPLGPVPSWVVQKLANLRVIERARAIAGPRFELRIHSSAPGPMMHLKTAAFIGRHDSYLVGGQANYTPNSFSGAWLETGLVIRDRAATDAFLSQFTALWDASAPPPPGGALGRYARRALLWLVERLLFRF
jgi:phosphatidylserine/phosphatidylglycerophosphate/cardiolipin synthase-like enzyme